MRNSIWCPLHLDCALWEICGYWVYLVWIINLGHSGGFFRCLRIKYWHYPSLYRGATDHFCQFLHRILLRWVVQTIFLANIVECIKFSAFFSNSASQRVHVFNTWSRYLQSVNLNAKVSLCPGTLHIKIIVCCIGPPSETFGPGTYNGIIFITNSWNLIHDIYISEIYQGQRLLNADKICKWNVFQKMCI